MPSTFALTLSIAAIVVVIVIHKFTGSLFRRQDKNGNKPPSVGAGSHGSSCIAKKAYGRSCLSFVDPISETPEAFSHTMRERLL